jgi:hypothetical protein
MGKGTFRYRSMTAGNAMSDYYVLIVGYTRTLDQSA